MDYCGRVIANKSVTIISLETTWVKRMKQLKIAKDEINAVHDDYDGDVRCEGSICVGLNILCVSRW